MSQAKYYDSGSGTWKPIIAGPAGPAGPIAGTNTQVIYNSSGVASGSANLTWDGTTLKALNLSATNSSGSEGGEITLNKPASGTTIDTSVTFDVYQDKVRLFETGGTNRGYYFDMSLGSATVGTSITASPRIELEKTSSQSVGASAVITGWTTNKNVGGFTYSSGYVTVPYTGAYLVVASLEFSSNATGYRDCRVINGSGTLISYTRVPTVSGTVISVNHSYVTTLSASSQIGIEATQSSGATLTVGAAGRTFFNVIYLGTD